MISSRTFKRLTYAGWGAGIVAGLLAPQSSFGQLFLYAAISFAIIIPLHELGHALAGGLVGFRIAGIVVGTGPSLLAFRVAGATVQINALPLGGVTLGMPTGRRALRLRHWIFAAGGPAANVFIYFALRRLFSDGGGRIADGWFVSTAIWLNWSVLVLNLIPFRGADGMFSDGYGLFTIPFWSKDRIALALVHAEMAPVAQALNLRDFETARRLGEAALARHPEHPLPLLFLGSARHALRQHEEARALWRAALTAAKEPRLVAGLKNNVAFVDAVIGRDEDLEEADRLSQEAQALLTEDRSVMGTRGAVLTRLGRAREALPLLERSQVVTQTPQNQAYTKVFMATALAALGRAAEARLNLAEARRLDPSNELLARAEADVALGRVEGADRAPPQTDLSVQADALRRWRRDARLLAFGAVFFVMEGFGTAMIGPCLSAVFLSLVPEVAGMSALAVCGIWGVGLRAFGLIATDAGATSVMAAPLSLVMGLIACWLLVRHRRLAPPPSRVPTVLGWVLAGISILLAMGAMLGLALDRSALGWHESSRNLVGATTLPVALTAVLLTRRRTWVRLLAILPAAAAGLVITAASSWYLNRVALAGVAIEGPGLVWSPTAPATAARSRTITVPGRRATVSPGGGAFFVGGVEGEWGGDSMRLLLRVGDFNNRLVDVEGSGGAFIDDERLVVLRRSRGPLVTDELVELRPFAGGAVAWSKPMPRLDGFVNIDVTPTGDVYIWQRYTDDGSAAAFQTTIDAMTSVEPVAVKHRDGDELLAHHLRPSGWDGMLVARRLGMNTTDVWWRTPGGDRRLLSRLPSPDCAQFGAVPTTTTVLWCHLSEASALLRIDVTTGVVTRLPDSIRYRYPIALGNGRLAMIGSDEIAVVALETRRAIRLALPKSGAVDDARGRVQVSLVEGGRLGTLAARRGSKEATLVVYEEPRLREPAQR